MLRAHVHDEAVVLAVLRALDDVVPVLPADVEDRALGGLVRTVRVVFPGRAHLLAPFADDSSLAGRSARSAARRSVVLIRTTSARPAAARWPRGTRRGCRRGGSPCAAGGPSSRPASCSGSAPGARRRSGR